MTENYRGRRAGHHHDTVAARDPPNSCSSQKPGDSLNGENG